MCIAVPGRILSLSQGRARVDFSGNVLDVDARLVDAQPGDYILVHAGCAIEVVRPEEAEDLSALLREIGELGHEGS